MHKQLNISNILTFVERNMDARDIGDLYRTLQYAAERLGREDKEKNEDLFKCTFIIEWLMDMADRDQAEGKRICEGEGGSDTGREGCLKTCNISLVKMKLLRFCLSFELFTCLFTCLHCIETEFQTSFIIYLFPPTGNEATLFTWNILRLVSTRKVNTHLKNTQN